MSLTKENSGLMPTSTEKSGGSASGALDSSAATISELSMLRRLQDDMAKSLKDSEEENETVQFVLTPDGLRINIFDRSRKPIFEAGSATFTEYGSWVLSTLAWQISRYNSFTLELEGHTERGFQPVKFNYGSWELSADRANAGRRKLLEHGVLNAQVKKVAGFGDTVPLPDTEPDSPMNRRIALLLRVNDSNHKS
jgi:chemotaxis protein MotB